MALALIGPNAAGTPVKATAAIGGFFTAFFHHNIPISTTPGSHTHSSSEMIT